MGASNSAKQLAQEPDKKGNLTLIVEDIQDPKVVALAKLSKLKA